MIGYNQQYQGGGGGGGESSEPTIVPGTINITNIGPEATVEKLGELFGSLGKIKVKCYCSIALFEMTSTIID